MGRDIGTLEKPGCGSMRLSGTIPSATAGLMTLTRPISTTVGFVIIPRIPDNEDGLPRIGLASLCKITLELITPRTLFFSNMYRGDVIICA